MTRVWAHLERACCRKLNVDDWLNDRFGGRRRRQFRQDGTQQVFQSSRLEALHLTQDRIGFGQGVSKAFGFPNGSPRNDRRRWGSEMATKGTGSPPGGRYVIVSSQRIAGCRSIVSLYPIWPKRGSLGHFRRSFLFGRGNRDPSPDDCSCIGIGMLQGIDPHAVR